MEEHTPIVGFVPGPFSDREVERTAAAIFPERDTGEVLAALERVAGCTETHANRIRMAILKLCHESTDRNLLRIAEQAERDWRDVVAWAESPGLMAAGTDLSAGQRATLTKRDREQYCRWLGDVCGNAADNV